MQPLLYTQTCIMIYGYIEELIVGIFAFIPELLIFPLEDLRKLRIEEDNITFSDCQNFILTNKNS